MKWRKYLPLIGVLLFIYLIIRLNIAEITSEIYRADIRFLILAISFVALMLIMQTLKWLVIAYKQKIYLPFQEAFKIQLISGFYGFVTPSKLGTIVRAEYLKKYTRGIIGKGISNFVLDKILDTASVFFLAIAFSFVYRDKFKFLPINLFIGLFLVMILMTVIFVNKHRSRVILGIFYKRFLPKKMKKKARITFESFYEDMPKKRHFIVFFILNIATWIITYIIMFLVGVGVGINIPILYFFAIFPIGTIISLIPISINGLGTREAVLISLFGLFGVSAAKVFSMSIICLFISGILPAIPAIWLIFKKNNHDKYFYSNSGA